MAAPETCDGLDNDCDTEVDEDYDLTTDPLNCGACGYDCRVEFPNAVVSCSPGTSGTGECNQVVCLDNYYDIDPADPGCEYYCEFAGVEACNSVDDDCDGVVDDWTPPVAYCGYFGECVGVTVTCEDPDGPGGTPAAPDCAYPATYEAVEVTCDGLDNDCDGTVDEGFDVGPAFPCVTGNPGLCHAVGHQECDPASPTGPPICVFATTPPEPGDFVETCNGIDDDCDNEVDEGIALTDMNSIEVSLDVDLNGDGDIRDDESGRTFWVFQYEACL